MGLDIKKQYKRHFFFIFSFLLFFFLLQNTKKKKKKKFKTQKIQKKLFASFWLLPYWYLLLSVRLVHATEHSHFCL
ncbi:uncharacterized protein BX664DRAFT_68928 [Halteromyces radiatus]|uniref:uncharacterized protein n=1 Tax=Halteromyces radiatus TaxID=101107 RepID=UPI00221FB5BF|nr:uncharacterized protein BX664DRAFT_68928 [Halteromyces radiatus]KAI8096915.1 hypothetical protein BX664DRAFT_68928 [Halteromyces radiatus]